MNIQRTQGFTLPQLLVATAIGGILLLSVGMLVNTGLNAQTSETSQTAAKTAIRRINDNIASTVRSGSFGVMEKLNSKAAPMVFLNQAGAYSVANSASFRNNDSLTLQGSEALDLSSGERVMLINNVGDAVMMNVTSVAGRTITHDCKNTIPFTANTRLFKTTSYGVALGSALGTSYNASSLYEMVGGTWSEIAYDVTDFSLRTLYRDTANNTIVVNPADASSYAGLSPAFIPEAPTSARGRVPNVPNVTARSGTEYNLYALAVTTTTTGVSGGDTLNRAYGEQMPLTSDSSSPVKKLYNCAGGSDVGTDSGGTLYVGVNNAPAPTTVTVSGPSAWSRSVSSTQTFENLQNGTYTGTAPDVTYNTYETWRARWTSNPSTVNSWTGARMIAQYERLPGTLNVQIDGLPAGVDASNALSLNGPSGYTRSSWNNGANTITDAPPGEYNVNVGDVQSGLATYRGAARLLDVDHHRWRHKHPERPARRVQRRQHLRHRQQPDQRRLELHPDHHDHRPEPLPSPTAPDRRSAHLGKLRNDKQLVRAAGATHWSNRAPRHYRLRRHRHRCRSDRRHWQYDRRPALQQRDRCQRSR